MIAQPIGASGQELGATLVVAIETMIEQTVEKLVIPCFVMTSARPIWQGLYMVLGTNALVSFVVQMVLDDGSVVKSAEMDTTKYLADSPTNGVFFGKSSSSGSGTV